MDTTVDPCTDFFTYSCGGWLKKNPIPPDKTSWGSPPSWRMTTGCCCARSSKKRRRAARAEDPVKQKIGDYYAACMDEKAIEAAGTTPLKAGFERIDGMHSKRDIASGRRQHAEPRRAVRLQLRPGLQELPQVIAELDQGGLGLPDRDYYLKTDPKSVELRQAYVAHVQKMFELLGDAPAVCGHRSPGRPAD